MKRDWGCCYWFIIYNFVCLFLQVVACFELVIDLSFIIFKYNSRNGERLRKLILWKMERKMHFIRTKMVRLRGRRESESRSRKKTILRYNLSIFYYQFWFFILFFISLSVILWKTHMQKKREIDVILINEKAMTRDIWRRWRKRVERRERGTKFRELIFRIRWDLCLIVWSICDCFTGCLKN